MVHAPRKLVDGLQQYITEPALSLYASELWSRMAGVLGGRYAELNARDLVTQAGERLRPPQPVHMGNYRGVAQQHIKAIRDDIDRVSKIRSDGIPDPELRRAKGYATSTASRRDGPRRQRHRKPYGK